MERRTWVILLAELSFILMGVKHYIFAKFTARTLCKALAEHLSCLFRSEPPDSNRVSLQFLQEQINAATPRWFGSIMQVKAWTCLLVQKRRRTVVFQRVYSFNANDLNLLKTSLYSTSLVAGLWSWVTLSFCHFLILFLPQLRIISMWSESKFHVYLEKKHENVSFCFIMASTSKPDIQAGSKRMVFHAINSSLCQSSSSQSINIDIKSVQVPSLWNYMIHVLILNLSFYVRWSIILNITLYCLNQALKFTSRYLTASVWPGRTLSYGWLSPTMGG